jgi:hypothetical protein
MNGASRARMNQKRKQRTTKGKSLRVKNENRKGKIMS